MAAAVVYRGGERRSLVAGLFDRVWCSGSRVWAPKGGRGRGPDFKEMTVLVLVAGAVTWRVVLWKSRLPGSSWAVTRLDSNAKSGFWRGDLGRQDAGPSAGARAR